MSFKIGVIICVAYVLCGLSLAEQENSENRMDDSYHYFRRQKIHKAFKECSPPWFFGYASTENEKSPYSGQGPCTFFRKESINETNVVFSKHNWDNKNWTTTPLYGTFFRTQGRGNTSQIVDRPDDNGVTVSDNPSGANNKSYKLVFTNYRNCSIIRPVDLAKIGLKPGLTYEGHTSTLEQAGSKDCILMLADELARKVNNVPGDLPTYCKSVYRNICGRQPSFKIIFKDCPNIPNPLGC